MSLRIEQPIVGYAIAGNSEAEEAPDPAPEGEPSEAALEAMHERMARPERIEGATYKIKPPQDESAIYLTINDVVLNEGPPQEQRHPFEIFVNSKNMDHFQWIVALTRIISAVFRKGGDMAFLVEELRSVFDPRGGYFRPGGRFMASVVAEIGDVIEKHLRSTGFLEPEEPDEHQQALIAEKRAQYEASSAQDPASSATVASDASPAQDAEGEDNDFPPGAELCKKCHTKAMVLMDGCMTCLACGESKCS